MNLGEFFYQILNILVTPTCSPTHDDDVESKESEGMAEEIGIENVPDTTPGDV